MKKSLQFYVMDEHTDTIKYCKTRGLIPYKFKKLKCELDDNIINSVIQYVKDGYVYDVLEGDQCYTKWHMIILMRLPKLSYQELLSIALHSKYLEERIGAIGIILKDYSKDFEETLVLMNNSEILNFSKKKAKKMASYVYELIDNSHHIQQLENIKNLCKELELRLS